jgi:hypothetical protein
MQTEPRDMGRCVCSIWIFQDGIAIFKAPQHNLTRNLANAARGHCGILDVFLFMLYTGKQNQNTKCNTKPLTASCLGSWAMVVTRKIAVVNVIAETDVKHYGRQPQALNGAKLATVDIVHLKRMCNTGDQQALISRNTHFMDYSLRSVTLVSEDSQDAYLGAQIQHKSGYPSRFLRSPGTCNTVPNSPIPA